MIERRALAFVITGAMRALGATLRIDFRDQAGYFDPERLEPCIAASWHNRIFVLPICFKRLRNRQRLTVLTSASRDGALLAQIVQNFGLGAVRGSSSRRGATAIRELQAVMESGSDVIITPDGPRGPRYELSPGIIYLAHKTGARVFRIQVDYSRFWELKSWDRFRVPKPFSKVVVTLHPLEKIEPFDSDEAFERSRRNFEERLRAGQV